MKAVISEASGMIGRALCADFQRVGHTVTRLVRRAPAGPGERRLTPPGGSDPELVAQETTRTVRRRKNSA